MPKAVTLLYQLMPDTNTATNHNEIVCIVPVSYVLYIYTQHSQRAVSIYSREVALKPEGQMHFTIVHVRTILSPPYTYMYMQCVGICFIHYDVMGGKVSTK